MAQPNRPTAPKTQCIQVGDAPAVLQARPDGTMCLVVVRGENLTLRPSGERTVPEGAQLATLRMCKGAFIRGHEGKGVEVEELAAIFDAAVVGAPPPAPVVQPPAPVVQPPAPPAPVVPPLDPVVP